MTNGQRVLVVDGLAETEEVLKAVLEPEGLEVNRIRRHFDAAFRPVNPPHLVILHEDRQEETDSWPDIPRVIIGSVADFPAQANPSNGSRAQYLAQPFQYRDLIEAVKHLLAE